MPESGMEPAQLTATTQQQIETELLWANSNDRSHVNMEFGYVNGMHSRAEIPSKFGSLAIVT